MRYLLLLSATGLLVSGGIGHAAPPAVEAYLARASAQASAVVAAAGVDVGPGLRVKATVADDGRLMGRRVVASTGSFETDQKAARALRRLKVAAPPNTLIGAEVVLAIGQPEAKPR